MTWTTALAAGAALVVAFTLGRLSARRTITHLREQLHWRIALGQEHLRRRKPQHRAKPDRIPPAPVLVSPYNLPPPIKDR